MAKRHFMERQYKKVIRMKTIYLKEGQLQVLQNQKKEVTFYEFVIAVKSFLKDLLKKPSDAKPCDLFARNNITKQELLSKMSDLGLVKKSERIDEVPIEETKKVAKRYATYKVPKARFTEKLKELYKDLFSESNNKPQVFKNSSKLITDILNMDEDNAYKNRGGFDESLVQEDGMGGATTCGSVMQGGGSNPSAGQYDVPFGGVQNREFWKPAMKRNKDEKNKSITMNRKK